MLHHLQDYRGLSRSRLSRDDDSAVGGQVRGEMFADLAVEPVSTKEQGIGLCVGYFKEQGLQGPVELAVLRFSN